MKKNRRGLSTSGVQIMPTMGDKTETYPEPKTSHEKPGYTLCPWVTDFIETPEGPVPRIAVTLDSRDLRSTFRVRCGIGRNRYTITPGLYAAGHPNPDSEVLVTANFKLTFDHLRKQLSGINAWILVLDTKGINVWCAAGKGTFGTRELVLRIQSCNLEKVVRHKRLILPQLGATGISAKDVKKRSGFRVIYGPVRAADLPRFLADNKTATPAMRQVTFTFAERLVLTPVEIQGILKPAMITAVVLFLISGLGPGIFSPAAAWYRGITALGAMATGILSGAVITPALLPLIPVRGFALKGIITGGITAALLIAGLTGSGLPPAAVMALFLFTLAVSSFLAMNFTGATPFTAPSGVEKEMKQYIPIQLACLAISTGCWIYGAF